MSYDLKLENNDLSINPDGTVKTVRDNEKLKQDIVRAILTPVGANAFHQWYGSTINAGIVGSGMSAGQIEAEAKRSIQETLNNLISLQKTQARIQYVSPGEQLMAVREIEVLQDDIDPRQFQVTVYALTRLLTPVEETFTMLV